MLRTRLGIATLLAGTLLLVGASTASADNNNQKGKGKNAPEVPTTAGLPVVAALSGATFFVLTRARRKTATKQASAGTNEE